MGRDLIILLMAKLSEFSSIKELTKTIDLYLIRSNIHLSIYVVLYTLLGFVLVGDALVA